MAKLDTYQRTGSIETGSTGPQASADAFNGGLDERTGKQFMGAALQAADVLDKRRREDDAVWANSVAMKSELHWQEYMIKAQTGPDAGKPGFSLKIQEEYEKYMQETIESAPTQSTQTYLMSHLGNLGQKVQGQALTFEAQERLAARTNEMSTAIDAATALASRAGSFEEAEKLAQGQMEMVSGISGLQPHQKLALGNQAKEIYKGWLVGQGEQDPRGVLQTIEEGKLDGKVDGGWLAGYMTHLRSKADQLDAITGMNNANAKKNLSLYRQTNGKNPNWYTPPKDSKGLAKASAQEQYDYEMYHGRQYILNNEPKNIDVYVRSLEQAGKSDQAQQLAMFADKQLKMLNIDPGGAAMADSSVEGAYQEFQLAAQAAQGDKEKLAAADALRQKYVQLSSANQVARGVPTTRVNPVPLSDSAKYATQISKMALENPDATQSVFQQIENEWGDQYMNVVRGMQSDKLPENVRLPDAYSIVAVKKGKPEAANFIMSLATKDKDINDFVKTSGYKEDDFSKAVGENSVMRNLSLAINASGNRMGVSSSYNRAIERYSKYLMQRGLASKPSEAVAKAANSIFANEFHIGDLNGVKYAIPAADSNRIPYTENDVRRIQHRLDSIHTEIINSEPGQFNLDQFGGGDSRIKPEDRHYGVMRQLAKNAQWINTSDGRGVELYWDTTGKGDLVQVNDKNGKPIFESFDDLAYQPWLSEGLSSGPSGPSVPERELREMSWFNPKKWIFSGSHDKVIKHDEKK